MTTISILIFLIVCLVIFIVSTISWVKKIRARRKNEIGKQNDIL